MNADTQRIADLVHGVRTAWDQYTVQVRLPAEGGWRSQGHAWDAYNRERVIAEARRDPLAMSAAWDAVEEGLGELSAAVDRLRAEEQGARAAVSAAEQTPEAAWAAAHAVEPGVSCLGRAGWPDRRVGPYSPAPVADSPAEVAEPAGVR